MVNQPKVSLEFIAIGAKTQLPATIYGIVEKLREKAHKERRYPSDADVEVLAQAITKITGINMMVFTQGITKGPGVLMATYNSHSGISGRDKSTHTGNHLKFLDKDINKGSIDLEKVRVDGFFKEIPFILLLPYGVWHHEAILTTEELTAIILHEIGHAFFTLATIGEFVWLNYFLTDGVEILLGKKPNKYKIELVTDKYLASKVENKELYEKYSKHPTEANARRLVLEACKEKMRDHLNPNMGYGAYKRDEQLADQFTARLGFGRANITALDKLSGQEKRWRRSRSKHTLVEIAKLTAITPLGLFTFVVSAIFNLGLWGSEPYVSEYDYDVLPERIVKTRRELIAQVKSNVLSPKEKEIILEDIKVIDGILDGMRRYKTLLESLRVVFIPTTRRKHQNLLAEQRLEELLHNDLFIHSESLKQLA